MRLLAGQHATAVSTYEEHEIREASRRHIERSDLAVVQLEPLLLAAHIGNVMACAHPLACAHSRVADVRYEACYSVMRVPVWRVTHRELERCTCPVCLLGQTNRGRQGGGPGRSRVKHNRQNYTHKSNTYNFGM